MSRNPDLRDRAADLRDEALSRLHDLEDDLPVDVDDLTERGRTGVRHARIGGWQSVKALGTLLLVVPRMLVSGLGLLSDALDDLVGRGADVSERVKDAADRMPASRRTKRRRVTGRAGWIGVGFLGGLVAGWTLARRRAPLVTYEAPQPPQSTTSAGGPVTDELPAVDAGSVSGNGSSATDETADDAEVDEGSR